MCIKMVPISRMEERITVYPADVVLFEGILVFYPQIVREMFHMKLFVDTDSDVRLSRRGLHLRTLHTLNSRGCRGMITLPLVPVVLRDMSRGRDLEQILTQYTTFVKPAFEEFCLPVSATFPTNILCLEPFI